MALSSELISKFAKVVTQKEKKSDMVTVTGTAVAYEGKIYVRLDGSDQLTPVASSTAGMKDGDRITVQIKNHSATVTGNVSSPSTGKDDLENAKDEIGNKITEVEILIADKVSTEEFDAEKARIDNLVADNIVVKDKLTATEADITNLKAENVDISGKLTAAQGDIDNLKTTKLDVEIADIKFATIENLETTNADVHNLTVDYGDFKNLTADKLVANEAEINRLDTEKLSAEEADLKYANIDFANIGSAAIENFFSKSGMIGDLVVGDGTITGTLVGVTIKGDLIEGGTVKADKLVIKGEDGLYYKLNTNGETIGAQQTEYNSLNGSIITAKSITAEKVNVNDLVAFGATIGGFHITDSTIYSGVKESIDNTTRGTYMDDDGQFAIGDSSNYLKFFRDTDGNYKLDISAASIKFGASGETVENVVQDMVVKTETEYYISTSSTSLAGGSWSIASPTWSSGKYIWTRTKSTKKSGNVEYSNAACTTGAPGADGTPGTNGIGIKSTTITYQAGASQTSAPTGTWSTSVPKLSASTPYLWTKTVITYTDNKTSTSYSVGSTLDGVEVGGRNYVRASTLPDKTLNGVTIETDGPDVHVHGTNTGTVAYDIGTFIRQSNLVEPGETWTLSTTVPMPSGVYLGINTRNASGTEIDAIYLHGDGSRTSLTGKIPANSNGYFRGFIGIDTTAKVIDVTFRIKIEKGNKATDWTPAPEDVQQGIEKNTALIEQTNESINLKVSEINQTVNYNSSKITELEQTASGWEFNFQTIEQNLGKLDQSYVEQLKYIRFIDGEIWLGRDPDPGQSDFKVIISNERIRFMQDNIEIAYLSNNQLYITNTKVLNRLDLGKFAFFPRDNGNLTFRLT